MNAVDNLRTKLYQKVSAGRKGRGGEIIEDISDTELLKAVTLAVLETSDKQQALEDKLFSFPKFCKNIIQKVNNNPLAFITLMIGIVHTIINIGIFKRITADKS